MLIIHKIIKSQNSKTPPLCFLARIYKGLKKYLIDYYLYIMYVPQGVTMLILWFCDFMNCQHCWRASSVEVFFIDAELVTNKLYRSRWEELSRGRDTEGGDLVSVSLRSPLGVPYGAARNGGVGSGDCGWWSCDGICLTAAWVLPDGSRRPDCAE